MKVAVAGATGNIGARTTAALERAGHQAVPISRSRGVDLCTGEGLDEALTGVDAVIDATNAPTADRERTVGYFRATTTRLLDAESRAGVRHHVLLSIVGIATIEGNAHYAGKREQERLVEAGSVPWTIVPVTQFHDFAVMVASRSERDGVALVPPLLMQPIAPEDVAGILAEVAVGEPAGRYPDVAGPETQDLVDMARRTYAVLGRDVRLVPTWSGPFGESMAGNVLLPGERVRLGTTTFDQWLRDEAR